MRIVLIASVASVLMLGIVFSQDRKQRSAHADIGAIIVTAVIAVALLAITSRREGEKCKNCHGSGKSFRLAQRQTGEGLAYEKVIIDCGLCEGKGKRKPGNEERRH